MQSVLSAYNCKRKCFLFVFEINKQLWGKEKLECVGIKLRKLIELCVEAERKLTKFINDSLLGSTECLLVEPNEPTEFKQAINYNFCSESAAMIQLSYKIP